MSTDEEILHNLQTALRHVKAAEQLADAYGDGVTLGEIEDARYALQHVVEGQERIRDNR